MMKRNERLKTQRENENATSENRFLKLFKLLYFSNQIQRWLFHEINLDIR